MMLFRLMVVAILMANLVYSMDNNGDGNDAVDLRPRRRHRSYTLHEKIRLLDDFHSDNIRRGISSSAFARTHNVLEGTMRRWLCEEEELRNRVQHNTRRQSSMRRERIRGIEEKKCSG